jgi:hypothetical protein
MEQLGYDDVYFSVECTLYKYMLVKVHVCQPELIFLRNRGQGGTFAWLRLYPLTNLIRRF